MIDPSLRGSPEWLDLYPDTKEPSPCPICPECGRETDDYYVDDGNNVLGCDFCIPDDAVDDESIHQVDAYDWNNDHDKSSELAECMETEGL